ncbi:hypothetical protein BC6_00053 [Bacillus phage BC-6]|nr:hypothetical protein BC6_00053 [Bacillus phage BC-6]
MDTSTNGGQSFWTESVSQSFEDALVAEILRAFPEGQKVYSQTMTGHIPKECVIFTAKPMMATHASDSVRRRTVMVDIGVVTQKGLEFAYESLMNMTSLNFGEIKKPITGIRFSEVEGIVHMTFYMYIVEVTDY